MSAAISIVTRAEAVKPEDAVLMYSPTVKTCMRKHGRKLTLEDSFITDPKDQGQKAAVDCARASIMTTGMLS